jgi:hypothetical protein
LNESIKNKSTYLLTFSVIWPGRKQNHDLTCRLGSRYQTQKGVMIVKVKTLWCFLLLYNLFIIKLLSLQNHIVMFRSQKIKNKTYFAKLIIAY